MVLSVVDMKRTGQNISALRQRRGIAVRDLQEMLGITPYIYGVSGREWNDIPRQAKALLTDHGRDFDAIVILMGTND